jgi:predicted DNA-binding transcriptional regulator AlpA
MVRPMIERLGMRRDHGHVGLAEIAGMLGVTKSRAHRLTQLHADFPKPATLLRMGGVWHRDEVEAWITAHPNRTPGRPPRPADERSA